MSFPVAARKHNHTHKKNIRRPRSLLLLSSVSLFSIFLILKFRKRHHGPNKTQKAQVVGNLGERNKTTGVWCVCSPADEQGPGDPGAEVQHCGAARCHAGDGLTQPCKNKD